MWKRHVDSGWEVDPGIVRVDPQLVESGVVAEYDIVAGPPAGDLSLPLFSDVFSRSGQNYILTPASDSIEPDYMEAVRGRPPRWYEQSMGPYRFPYSVAALAKKERLPMVALQMHADESHAIVGDPEADHWGVTDPRDIEVDLRGHVGRGGGVISVDVEEGTVQRLAFRARFRPERLPDSVWAPEPGERGVGKVAMFWVPREDGPHSPDAMRDFPDPTEGLFPEQ